MIGVMKFIVLILSVLMVHECAAASIDVSDETSLRLQAMDANHDGMVTLGEMRTWLESQHGKGYEKDRLDEMADRDTSKSCASPFSRPFY